MGEFAVIFDVDGVLIDSYQAHFQSWRQMLAEEGVEFSEDQFRATFGRRSEEIIAALYDGKLDESQIVQLDDRKESLYREKVCDDFPAIDGAVDLIDELHAAGFALAVGSSGPPANVELTLECLGRAESFAAVVTRVDVTRGKPDPQVFQLAGRRLGVPAARCAVVEDAPAGVEAANRAGMLSIALTGTAARGDLAHAAMVVNALGELSAERIQDLLQSR